MSLMKGECINKANNLLVFSFGSSMAEVTRYASVWAKRQVLLSKCMAVLLIMYNFAEK